MKQQIKTFSDFLGIEWAADGTVAHAPPNLQLTIGESTIDDLKFREDWNLTMYLLDRVLKILAIKHPREYDFYSKVFRYEIPASLTNLCDALYLCLKEIKEKPVNRYVGEP